MESFRTEFQPDYDPRQQDRGLRSFLVDVLQTLLLSVALFVGINLVSARIRIESVSMENTLIQGDFVLVNKLAYKIGEPQRGDVIVFEPTFESPEPYIKRVIGLPGETIVIANGDVVVNDTQLLEPYIKSETRSSGTWVVPAGHLFVMGDNRNNSSDSRSWGFVPIENVIGKAEFVYLPVEHWGALSRFAVAAGPPVNP